MIGFLGAWRSLGIVTFFFGVAADFETRSKLVSESRQYCFITWHCMKVSYLERGTLYPPFSHFDSVPEAWQRWRRGSDIRAYARVHNYRADIYAHARAL